MFFIFSYTHFIIVLLAFSFKFCSFTALHRSHIKSHATTSYPHHTHHTHHILYFAYFLSIIPPYLVLHYFIRLNLFSLYSSHFISSYISIYFFIFIYFYFFFSTFTIIFFIFLFICYSFIYLLISFIWFIHIFLLIILRFI